MTNTVVSIEDFQVQNGMDFELSCISLLFL